MARGCEVCGGSLEGMDRRRRFCRDACRKAAKRGSGVVAAQPSAPETVPSTEVVEALHAELLGLGVAASYEGRVALGIAAQLDRGTVSGAAYASLSKELDRRVAVLRLKAERPDDPVRSIVAAVEEKRAALRSA